MNRLAIILLTLLLAACVASRGARYTEALVQCVDSAETPAESDACRDRVDERFRADSGAYR